MEKSQPPPPEINPLMDTFLHAPDRNEQAWRHFIRVLVERNSSTIPHLSPEAIAMAMEFKQTDQGIPPFDETPIDGVPIVYQPS
jgi:hypothetical protein